MMYNHEDMWAFIAFYVLELFEVAMFVFAGLCTLWFGLFIFIPNIEDVEQIIRRPYIRVLNKNGDLIASYGDFYGKPVEVDELPKYVVHALIDTEDRRFFQHFGFDLLSILRAFVLNVSAGRITQGGSSITQQLAKNFFISKGVFDTYDQSIQRKVYELILSIMLEQKYTKKQILSFYLNRVYFGASAFGIGAASERFFGKHPSELNVYEAARLVGAIQAPSRFVANKEQGDKRALQVIENMLRNKHITNEDKEMALLLTSKPEVTSNQPISRYFADWIVQCVPEEVYAQSDDLTIYTTLDPQCQAIAEKHAKELMDTWGAEWGAQTVALLSCDNDGAIQAMVGDLDYSKSKFNNVTSALRQPGSAFKIIVYLTALERGWESTSMISDEMIQLGSWKPKNFKYENKGQITLAEAFARSVNTVSLRLGMYVKPHRIIEMAQRLLITSPIPNNLSITLGTGEVTMLEMLTPLLTIANQGNLISPYGLVKIEDTRTQKLLYKRDEPEVNIVLSGKVINNMLDLKEANVTMGSGRKADFGHPAAGKTGSTQNDRDKWFVGFTSHAVTAVRFSTNKLGMNFIPGKPIAVELWRRYMEEMHKVMNFPVQPLDGSDEDNVMNKTTYKGMMSDIAKDTFVEKLVETQPEEKTAEDNPIDNTIGENSRAENIKNDNAGVENTMGKNHSINSIVEKDSAVVAKPVEKPVNEIINEKADEENVVNI